MCPLSGPLAANLIASGEQSTHAYGSEPSYIGCELWTPSSSDCGEGDLQLALSPDRNKIHSAPDRVRYLKGACH
jgi:hypothetical protein